MDAEAVLKVAAELRDGTLMPGDWRNQLADRLESAARGGGEAVAWMTDDGRVISATQKASAERDGGASRSSVAPYSIPLYATPPAPAIPEGYVIVPREPAAAMISTAFESTFPNASEALIEKIWKLMLTAAPTPEVQR